MQNIEFKSIWNFTSHHYPYFRLRRFVSFRFDLFGSAKKWFFASAQWLSLLLLFIAYTIRKGIRRRKKSTHHTQTSEAKVHNKTGHFHWIRLQYNENVELFRIINRSKWLLSFLLHSCSRERKKKREQVSHIVQSMHSSLSEDWADEN